MTETPSDGKLHKLFAIAIMVVGILIAILAGDPEENPGAFVGYFILIGGFLLHFRGRRLAARARAAGAESPLLHPVNSVLYLRAFGADTNTVRKELGAGITSEEEQLADVLRRIGELIAIGRPGEKLPLPGAARMYVSDSEWQTAVKEHMSAARLVVLRAGLGSGLFWELNEAIAELHPGKFVMLILGLKTHDYRAFAAEVRQNLGVELPNLESNSVLRGLVDWHDPLRVPSGFVRFASDWTAEFLPIPYKVVRVGYNDLRGPLNQALHPVFASLGVPWQAVGRF